MGDMVCLCGKAFADPIDMYTKEKDPFFACMDKCMKSPRSERPSYEEVQKHNNNHEYKKGGRIWGK